MSSERLKNCFYFFWHKHTMQKHFFKATIVSQHEKSILNIFLATCVVFFLNDLDISSLPGLSLSLMKYDLRIILSMNSLLFKKTPKIARKLINEM